MAALAGPDLFQIVEAANFRAEQMYNDVAEIDQYPVCIWQAFELWRLSGFFFDLLREMVSD